jgi:hypothetical protein
MKPDGNEIDLTQEFEQVLQSMVGILYLVKSAVADSDALIPTVVKK